MINLIISIIVGALSWVASAFIFDSVWTGIFPFIVFFIASMIFLGRRTSKKVTAIIQQSQEMMTNLPKLPSETARLIMMDKAVDKMKEAYAYKNYQFMLAKVLNSQIGMIYYVQNKLKEAEPYLADAAIPKQGTATAMYACLLYRRNDFDGMAKAFELAVKLDKSQPLLFNVYAWCLMQQKKRDEAIRVLNQCLASNPSDKTTKDNLDLIKNSGKVKMRDYNEQWYQFRLEDPPQMKLMAQYAQHGMRAR